MSIEEAFVGNLKNIKKTVVVSPVFYPNKFGLKGERTPVGNIVVHNGFSYIKTYPSSCWIYDTVLCLRKTKAKKIIFIGTAGAISNKLKIGDIVIAKSKGIQRIWSKETKAITDIPPTSVLSLDSILSETKENINRFIKQGYDAIDLEAESFYKACRKMNKTGLAILVIQDKPLSKPFYKPLSQEDEERLRDGILRLFDICKNLSNT